MSAFVRRLFRDEDGQDLVEYALLTAAIGFAALAAVGLIMNAINSSYTSQVNGVNSLWDSPAPGGGS